MKMLKFRKLVFVGGISLFAIMFLSCSSEAGSTRQKMIGNEPLLPDELKGLKVYWVSTGNGDGVNVAVLDGAVNSAKYTQGKSTKSTIIINRNNDKLIEVSQIIMENDSMIVCRK